MASTLTRLEIVTTACAQAGVGSETYSHAKILLNVLLKSWALKKQWPQLRKVGTAITLTSGGTTATLPTDFGFGMEKLMLGTEKIPLIEVEWDEFVMKGGFPATSAGTAVPTHYVIDKNAGVIRFNYQSDQTYSVYPIYYMLPTFHPYDSGGDAEYPWYDDDQGLLEGLIKALYQFKEDPREGSQREIAAAEVGEFRRGISQADGGGGTVRLSPGWFKNRGK